MTRFARAIGSKSSNARVKADPTPWSEMAPPKTTGKRTAESIEDDEVTAPKTEPAKPPKKAAKVVKLDNAKLTSKAKTKPKPSKKENKPLSNSEMESEEQKENDKGQLGPANVTSNMTNVKPQEPSKKNKKKGKNAVQINDEHPSLKGNEESATNAMPKEKTELMEVTLNDATTNSEAPVKKGKKKKKGTIVNTESSGTKENTGMPVEETFAQKKVDVESNEADPQSPTQRKKNKKKQKKIAQSTHQNSASDTNKETKPSSEEQSELSNATCSKEQGKPKNEKNPKKVKSASKDNHTNSKFSQKNPRNKWQKSQSEDGNSAENSANKDSQENNDGSQMDGWNRIKKKRVNCLRCRKMGHKANECRQERKGKLCYKCGDTQHTSRECSITEEVYKFAECFICRQTGHLTRSCPNNTKGIYPHGGACFKCGENTHLAKDCPTLRKVQDGNEDSKEEKKEVFIGILDAKQSADADVSESVSATPKTKKGKKQVVKF